MAGLEADVSSYNQQPLPVSPLDMAKNLGALQQQKLQIDQAKLDQANQGLQYMTRAMGALGPDAPKEAYIKAAADAVKMGLVPPQQLKVFEEKAMAAPDSKSFFNEFITAAADHKQQIDYHLGQPTNVNTGQTIQPAVRSVKPGFGERPIGMPVQLQAPPTATGYDENNQPRALGAQPPQLVPGSVSVPTPLPTYRPAGLPVEPMPAPTTGPTGPTINRTAETPTTFDNRFPSPRGVAAGASPLFEEGKKAYTVAQMKAGANAQAIKPAVQALKLMPGLATGPGTAQFNDLVAAAKAWGIVNTKAENDPTVMRQEVEKKLAQFVGSSPIGQRSDAAQTLAEAGSPNPKKQILPALQNLTRDAIGLYRVEQILPQVFKGTDYQNFIKHQGTFPQSIDEKALTLDLMDDADRNKLVKKMAIQYEKGNAREKAEAIKFKNTLELAKQAGIFGE